MLAGFGILVGQRRDIRSSRAEDDVQAGPPTGVDGSDRTQRSKPVMEKKEKEKEKEKENRKWFLVFSFGPRLLLVRPHNPRTNSLPVCTNSSTPTL